MNDLQLIWTANGKTLHGYDPATTADLDEIFSHGPIFPGTITEPKTVFVTSSCIYNRCEISLYNLALFIEGDDDTVKTLTKLAVRGHGVQVSFDDGWNWASLTRSLSFIERRAIITNPGSGVLGPYDTLKLKFRVSVPDDFGFTGKLSYRIGVDFDVL
jgi:hypothetical protein